MHLFNRVHEETGISEPVGKMPILFSNQPSGKKADDLVGMEAHVETIRQAVADGNRLIGILSDFGTGKSTLTEQLRCRYAEEENYRVCTINLWGELARSDGASTDDHRTEENLHKSFLYQFARQVSSTCGSYVNQRLNVGYKVMKLSARNGSSVASLVGAAVLFAWALLFDKELLPIPRLLPESIFGVVPLLLILGAVGLLALGLSRSELLFTSPKEQQSRQLHAEDYSEIYAHILRTCRRRRIFRRKNRHKKILLIFEDIDRTPDPRAVYQFLVELHRYYLSGPDPDHAVTFLINMKPQAILEQDLQKQVPENARVALDFVKLFDFTISLEPLNTADLSQLLLQYAKANQDFYAYYRVLKPGEQLASLQQLPGFSWLAHGEMLDIRHLKHRLNNTNRLFYSLHARFDRQDQDVNIQLDHCAAVAYLEDQYPREFYSLKPDTIGRILGHFLTSGGSGLGAWMEAVGALTGSGDAPHSSPFQKDLSVFLHQGLIGQDYRMYFYNYPRHSTVRTFDEDLLFNTFIYGKDLQEAQLPVVDAVCQSGSTAVADALDYRKGLGLPLPWTAFACESLYLRVLELAPDRVEAYLNEHIYPQQADETLLLVERLTSFPAWQTDVCGTQRQLLLELLTSRLAAAEVGAASSFRLALVERLRQRATWFPRLFQEPLPPLSAQEARLLPSMGDIFQLVAPETVLPEVIGVLAEWYCQTTHPPEEDRKALEQLFLATMQEVDRGFTQEFYTPILRRHLRQVQAWIEPMEQYVYQAAVDGELEHAEYAELVNQMPMEDAPEAVATHITVLSIHSGLSAAVCGHLLRYGQGTAYFHNARERCLTAAWSESEASVFAACAIDLAQSDPALFLDLRLRLCQQFAASIQEYAGPFVAPLPQLTADELPLLKLEDGLGLLEKNPPTEEAVERIAVFLSGQPRTTPQVRSILGYVIGLKEETVRCSLFQKLCFENLPLKFVGKALRQSYWEAVAGVFPMETATEILEYLRHTNYLDEQLEQRFLEAVSDGQEHEADLDAYGKLLLLPLTGDYTETTIRIVRKDPRCRVRPEPVLQRLFEEGQYQLYVISRVVTDGKFVFEEDKLTNLQAMYLQLYKDHDDTYQRMVACRPFMEYLYGLGIWNDLPPQKLLPFAKFPQTVPLLEAVLAQDDAFVLSYLSAFPKEIPFADEASRRRLIEAFTDDARPALILDEAARKALLRSVQKEEKQPIHNAYQRAKR